ncbi:hypothetical protein F4805DRAFT_413219 [Annulohypoxylon moriforme]|nr:hypothetical protein F4805DRAFT_413219 [Annulohypoxylon moriforme]
MPDIRSLVLVWTWFAIAETKLEPMLRVASRGSMIGAAILISAIAQYENSFYRLLVSCVFMVGTFVHVLLNWQAVKRYFFLALIGIMLPGLITLPYSKASIPLLFDRLPILIMLMGLFIEEFSRLLRCLMPDPRLVPPDVVSKPDEDSVPPILGHDKDLFAHMDGGEMEQYNTPSQASSDISLSNVGPGKLPSSCDTMTHLVADVQSCLLEHFDIVR